jgi:exonuclease VII small subunit
MGRNLENAERSLNALQNYGDKLSEQAKEQVLKEFAEAVEQMRSGSLPLDPSLLQELSQIDPKNLKSMSKEQLDQLRESLKNKGGKCEGMCEGFGQEKGFFGDENYDSMKNSPRRDNMPSGPGREGPGNGGVNRGPGDALLTLSDEENDFGAGKNEGVKSDDFTHAQLGTTLGIQDGKHEVDKTSSGPTAAGAVQSQGQGGEQVWRESLTPEEKAVLKRVFK